MVLQQLSPVQPDAVGLTRVDLAAATQRRQHRRPRADQALIDKPDRPGLPLPTRPPGLPPCRPGATQALVQRGPSPSSAKAPGERAPRL